ncbi:hypothetical protein BG011_009084 [Mortierella polycephala]|uniref:Uncharacterized protein n=1 Tax=Mortierella polycephala TaxID=41804 RepID=A0A9P6U839_9FUNG|nr:hypothetical protein BG011_009084 [Mortierella polycephala]
MATTSAKPVGFDLPPSSATSVSASASGAPLSVSIPRQRSFSSSFSLATSPRTFTGSSIITNPNNALLNSSGAAAAFAPMSPATSTASGSTPATSGTTSQTIPVLHRRLSSSFNQLNQLASTPPNNGTQMSERGRRTSLFGGSSPPKYSMGSTQSTETNKSSGGSLFRKFSTKGRSAGHPFDRNDAGHEGQGPQPNSNIFHNDGHQEGSLFSQASGNSGAGGNHLSAVDRLKPSQDKHSRSSSPMRSMILNGQMLD